MPLVRKRNKKQSQPIEAIRAPKRAEIQDALRLGYLLTEKCELKSSEECFLRALKLAKKAGDPRATIEALSALLWLSGEALNESAIKYWEDELDGLMTKHPKGLFSMAWYCKGSIARNRGDYKLAQRYAHRYLRLVRTEKYVHSSAQLLSQEELTARGWVMLSMMIFQRGFVKRAQFLSFELMRRYGAKNLKGVNGLLYLLMGRIAEHQRDLDGAWKWYQKAHGSFLAEHHWYYHLYVLFGYAKIARMQQNYPQAYWYLDLMDKAAPGPEFGALRQQIMLERSRLEQDALDLLIDSRRGVVKTRDGAQISLRKQYVLLHILEALSAAHGRMGDDSVRGLSKAEIIEKVWRETYRPEAHDNKLYYNINRLRKLIEPDIRNPHYLLNWKEGYRLAPGLRVRFVGGRNDEPLLSVSQGGEKVRENGGVIR